MSFTSLNNWLKGGRKWMKLAEVPSGVDGWSDDEVLLQGGDGHSFPLKAYKAKMFADEIVRLRKLLREKS